MVKFLYFSVLLSILLCHAVATADIYKWVDKQGVTHYGEKPPADSPAEKLDDAALMPAKIGTVVPVATTPAATVNQAESDAASIKQRDKAQAATICQQAKFSLEVLQTHTRLQQKDENSGAMVKMTEEQRQQAINEQQQRISLFCQAK